MGFGNKIRKGFLFMGLILALIGFDVVPAFASSVSTWGSNEYGKLGDGHTSSEQLYSNVPVAVSGLTEAVQVVEGCNHDLALLSNGTVTSWGSNERGQLGFGREEWEFQFIPSESNIPVIIPGLEHVKEVAAGCNTSMARLENGEVRIWGHYGENYGSAKISNPGLTNIVGIGITSNTSSPTAYAIRNDGTVWSWGWNGEWELGWPEPQHDMGLTPGEVEHISNEVRQIAAGATFAITRMTNNTVVVWGGNSYGQHGNGTHWPYLESACYADYEACALKEGFEPTSASISNVAQVAAYNNHALALHGLGEVSEWGNEPAFSSYSPLKVNFSEEATNILAGMNHNVAALRNGALMTWGTNEKGSLGIGITRGPEACGNIACERVPQEIKGFLETPHLGGAAAIALAKAPGPSFRTFTGFPVEGSFTINKLGATVPLKGLFNGKGALHGQIGGEITGTPQPASGKAFNLLPVTFGVGLIPATWDQGANAREYMKITYLSLLGLTLPTNCVTKEPFSINLEEPIENGGRYEGITGNFTISSFHCEGGFLGAPFSPILSLILSGAGNTYAATLGG